ALPSVSAVQETSRRVAADRSLERAVRYGPDRRLGPSDSGGVRGVGHHGFRSRGAPPGGLVAPLHLGSNRGPPRRREGLGGSFERNGRQDALRADSAGRPRQSPD